MKRWAEEESEVMWLPMHGLLYMVRSGRSRRPMHRSICSCSVLHLGRRHESGKTLGFPAFGFVSLCVWEIEIDVFLTSARTSAGRIGYIAHLAAAHSWGLRSKRSRSSMSTGSRLVQSKLSLICVFPLFTNTLDRIGLIVLVVPESVWTQNKRPHAVLLFIAVSPKGQISMPWSSVNV